MTLFIRLLDSPVDEKASRLRDAILRHQSITQSISSCTFLLTGRMSSDSEGR